MNSVTGTGASDLLPATQSPALGAYQPLRRAAPPRLEEPPLAGRPQPVVFETVDPNAKRNRLLIGVGGLVLALVAATGGFFVGRSHASPAADPTPTAIATPSASSTVADPLSPHGFFGTAPVGGVAIAGGQRIGGPQSKMSFMLPAGWQQQIDPKSPSDARYADLPYRCPGHGTGVCAHGLAVQNTRAFSGSWSNTRNLVLGMGQLLYAAQLANKSQPNQAPVKQAAVSIQGHSGYLALWHVPTLANQTLVPDSYCGVIAISPSSTATAVPVLQICLDHSDQAPALSVMDQIANSITITS
ncbi:hypothetical protein [Streptacidiphilus sp. PAMC 29251]